MGEMRINWIALVIAIALGYIGASMQFCGTHAIPEWLRKFFADDHSR
jgi:hypothetical protein